jgi:hypothetical protein
VFGIPSVDADVDAVGRILIEETIGQLAAALEGRVTQKQDAIGGRRARDYLAEGDTDLLEICVSLRPVLALEASIA